MLNAKNFGLAGGILFGGVILVMSLVATYTGYGESIVSLFLDVYPWAGLTILGSIFGGFWAFVDAFIGGWIFAKLYNWLEAK